MDTNGHRMFCRRIARIARDKNVRQKSVRNLSVVTIERTVTIGVKIHETGIDDWAAIAISGAGNWRRFLRSNKPLAIHVQLSEIISMLKC